MAEYLAKSEMAGLTLNLRGHGTSEGELDSLNVAEHISDAIAAYDFFVHQDGVDSERVGVCGSSYGSLLAVALARKRAVRSLLLRAPAAYSLTMIAMKFSALMFEEKSIFKTVTDFSNTPAIKDISNFTRSLLVVASENDDVIPQAIPQAYFDYATAAARKEFKLMKGAPHSLSGREDLQREFTAIMAHWFAETL